MGRFYVRSEQNPVRRRADGGLVPPITMIEAGAAEGFLARQPRAGMTKAKLQSEELVNLDRYQESPAAALFNSD